MYERNRIFSERLSVVLCIALLALGILLLALSDRRMPDVRPVIVPAPRQAPVRPFYAPSRPVSTLGHTPNPKVWGKNGPTADRPTADPVGGGGGMGTIEMVW